MKLRTFVRYDGNDRMIAGSASLLRSKPRTKGWEEIFFDVEYSSYAMDKGLFAFISYDKDNNFIPGTNILIRKKPKTGRWKQLNLYKTSSTVTTTTTEYPFDYLTFEGETEPITFEDGEINLQFE